MTPRLFCALALLACLLGAPPVAGQQITVDFEDLSLSSQSFENGANLSPPGSFTSRGAVFNNSYTAAFQSWTGWSYSNKTDVTTQPVGSGNSMDYTRQYTAQNLPNGGGAAGSANYGIANNFSPGDATITLPAGTHPLSMQVTNNTYAALAIKYGDGFSRPFAGPTGPTPGGDFFLLTIIGLDSVGAQTGSVPFYLADYRELGGAPDSIISQWTNVDLSSLAPSTRSLMFSLTSTDNGMFGMNTPAYFAMDNLVVTPTPEPALTAVIAGGGLVLWGLLRRRTRKDQEQMASESGK
jgi:hypothetical protein